MLRNLAKIFGYTLLTVGILGFIPVITTDGRLLGLFEVNAAHSIIHLLSGTVALYAGYTSTRQSHLYFRVFGTVYVIVAILGFYYGDRPLLGLVAQNRPDTWLHLFIGIVALYAGFGMHEREPLLHH